ncbi:MAG: lipoprotein signal peptidase [Chitinophagales bacterium]
MKTSRIVLIILGVLLIDQVLKVWIKLNMSLGQEHEIFSWFIIHFVENDGMAFGITFGGEYGKLALSLFRIVAVVFIGFFLRHLVQSKAPNGLIVSMSLIMAGAIGNIIDSTIYGVLFSASTYSQIATFLPEGGGYKPLLYGNVVDMFYFPLVEGNYPEWVPYIGGNRFRFFQPIFNIADSAITCGVAAIIIFQKSFFVEPTPETVTESNETTFDANTAQGNVQEAVVES